MDLKKLAGQAGQYLTRAVQYTEEKLGNAERTEFDGHYETLVRQSDAAKLWTEKLVVGAQSVVIPNPGNRVEDMLFEKLEKRRPNRLSNMEHLGLDMVQAGTEFGPGTSYGGALLRVGGAEQRVGLAERDFVGSAVADFLEPLQKFLDTDMKTIARERRLLDNKRLDLDAAKGRLRKARSVDAQQAAEAELRRCQAEFDRQTEITKLLLEGVRSTQSNHLKHLQALVAAQAAYHQTAHQILSELNTELGSLNPHASTNNGTPSAAPPSPLPYSPATSPMGDSVGVASASPPTNGRRARVVCDYDATSKEELSLMVNEEVVFVPIEGNSDFVQVTRAGRTGNVPRAYLEMLDD